MSLVFHWLSACVQTYSFGNCWGSTPHSTSFPNGTSCQHASATCTCYLGMFPFTFAFLCNVGRWQPTLWVLYKFTCYVFLQWSIHSSLLPSVCLFARLEGDSVNCHVCMLHASIVRCLLSTYVGPRPTVHYNIAWLGVLMSYPGHIQASRWGYHISTHFPKVRM